MYRIITANDARFIAENFIKQNNSISDVKEPELKGDAWTVEIDVLLPQFKKFQVKVNSRTGRIQGF